MKVLKYGLVLSIFMMLNQSVFASEAPARKGIGQQVGKFFEDIKALGGSKVSKDAEVDPEKRIKEIEEEIQAERRRLIKEAQAGRVAEKEFKETLEKFKKERQKELDTLKVIREKKAKALAKAEKKDASKVGPTVKVDPTVKKAAEIREQLTKALGHVTNVQNESYAAKKATYKLYYAINRMHNIGDYQSLLKNYDLIIGSMKEAKSLITKAKEDNKKLMKNK